ncbi:long-chain-fatty-acid--CoA ligase [Rhodococcus erythropolis]|uniref:class I adenylate-forming enzyme family protein n=1 Tax=Rhodococcus erythropolis TaxID=1833 RepID=UPI00210D5587|nr:long-chain-fatty-acid--CoA ligase [Rhodococcus erythropolis]MCQ4129083.1 long-chain-fatty-acid--CoA ligase [Rhodococcus erythropolis]
MEPTLGQLLSNRAYLSPDKEAFVGPGYRYTFAQVDQRVHNLAHYFIAHGVERGDRIAIIAKNGEFHATSVLAAARIGAIAVVVNWRLPAPELHYILTNSSAKVVAYESDFTATVVALEHEIPATVFVCNQDNGIADSYTSIVEVVLGEVEVDTEVTGDDATAIVYTSGTTGKPKGAVLSHSNLYWSAHATSCTIEWNTSHRFLLVAPMFHIGGLNPLITNILKGCPTIFMPDFDPVEVWNVIARERITTMMSVPVMLRAMLHVARTVDVDTSTLFSITCGASAVPPELIAAFDEMDVKIQVVYGITEFSGGLSFWTPSMGVDSVNSQGKVLLHGQAKIVDLENQQEVLRGTAGEVWCSGPMVFKGYWANQEATDAVIVEGWYRSGDVGFVDDDGFIYLKDRVKDMIISGGENIYPAELEAALSEHEAIAEVAVVGKQDPTWGEIPVAHVIVRPGFALTDQDVIDFCKQRLASYKCVKEVMFPDLLPKNSVGKVLKRQLRLADAN